MPTVNPPQIIPLPQPPTPPAVSAPVPPAAPTLPAPVEPAPPALPVPPVLPVWAAASPLDTSPLVAPSTAALGDVMSPPPLRVAPAGVDPLPPFVGGATTLPPADSERAEQPPAAPTAHTSPKAERRVASLALFDFAPPMGGGGGAAGGGSGGGAGGAATAALAVWLLLALPGLAVLRLPAGRRARREPIQEVGSRPG
jgi:hypothetical protein